MIFDAESVLFMIRLLRAERHGDNGPGPVGSLRMQAPQPGLPDAIRRFAALRRSQAALRHGDYQTLHVAPQQFAFRRGDGDDALVVAVNAAAQQAPIRVPAPAGSRLVDLLHAGESFPVVAGFCTLTLPACDGRVLAMQRG